MVTSAITVDNEDIPLLAEFIYRRYEYDGLDFEINAIKKVITFLHELYPSSNLLERRKMAQILKLQAITKFCHYAENVAAIAIAFKSTYRDEREEIKGIFNKIFTYSIGEIVDFYENMEKRQFSYIAKILGYPPLDLQDIR